MLGVTNLVVDGEEDELENANERLDLISLPTQLYIHSVQHIVIKQQKQNLICNNKTMITFNQYMLQIS